MVMYALAVVLLPLAMAGSIGYQQNMMYNQGGQWSGNTGYGVQMTGVIHPQGQMMQQGGQMMMHGGQMQGGQMQGGQANQWWTLQDSDEYAAYLKWCEERRMAIAEQEQQQAILKEIEARAEEQKREHEREKAAKEMQMRRESMVAQWRMWQSQLTQAQEYDGMMDKFTEMKVTYMFKLTMEFLKFCRCNDYTSHLQRYLIHGGESYQPAGASEAFSVEDLEGVDTSNVEAVAQRLATVSQAQQVKALYGGIIMSMCDSVKDYVEQVKTWETQYNFLGM